MKDHICVGKVRLASSTRSNETSTNENQLCLGLSQSNTAMSTHQPSISSFCVYTAMEHLSSHRAAQKSRSWSIPHQRLLSGLTIVTVINNPGIVSTLLTNCGDPVQHFLIHTNSPSRKTLKEDDRSWMWLVAPRNLERDLQLPCRRK